jgi:hypothetical protein
MGLGEGRRYHFNFMDIILLHTKASCSFWKHLLGDIFLGRSFDTSLCLPFFNSFSVDC